MPKKQYTQIGFVDLRDPATGDFCRKPIPLFALTRDMGPTGESGRSVAEEKALHDVGAIFAMKMKQYIDGGGLMEAAKG